MYTARLHIPSVPVKKNNAPILIPWNGLKAFISCWWKRMMREEKRNQPSVVRILCFCTILAGLAASAVHIGYLATENARHGRVMIEKWEIDARNTGVPFPLAVVCPTNWVNAKKLKTLFNLEMDDPAIVYMKSIISYESINTNNGKIMFAPENITYFNDTYNHVIKKRWRDFYSSEQAYSDQTFFTEIGYKCAEILRECVWNGYAFDCCKDTRATFTPCGHCFIIKVPSIDQLSLLHSPSSNQVIPGPRGGLSIKILTDKHTAFSPASASSPAVKQYNGTVLFLADPTPTTRYSPPAFSILNPLISPAASHAFVNLQAIERRRQDSNCAALPNLKYFSVYSKEACDCECRINASMDIFQCVPIGDAATSILDDSNICQSNNFYERFLSAANRFSTTTNVSASNVSYTTTESAKNSSVTSEGQMDESAIQVISLLSVDYAKAKSLVDAQYYYNYVGCVKQSCQFASCSPTFQFTPTTSLVSLYEREMIPAATSNGNYQNESLDSGAEYEDFSRITIFYSQLSYEVWFERRRNSLVTLFAAIGGSLALWAGISAVTLAQMIVSCLWAVVATCWDRRVESPETPPPLTPRASTAQSQSQGTRATHNAKGHMKKTKVQDIRV